MMKPYYADLHIHIGRTETGRPVKISGSKNLTFYNIAHEASERKGIEVIGIIDCHSPAVQEEIIAYLEITVIRCSYCGSKKIIRGVMDRILEIADREKPLAASNRPPYHYQVPLEFIPGLGSKKLNHLVQHYGTEMNIIHHVSKDKLALVAGEQIADYIIQAREGTLPLSVGGGGHYGKVIRQ